MPELAEVETTRRDLKKIIEGKKIKNVEVYLDKIVYNKPELFKNSIIGQRVISVNRRGKWLIFELQKSSIIIHFRMEGRFYLKNKDDLVEKHDYVIFYFKDFSLHYNDPRLFGKMQVIDNDLVERFFKEKELGLEYYDSNLTAEYLKKSFSGRSISIKQLLLDQKFIAGIGNIYADEILFRSKINPKKRGSAISIKSLQKIIDNTKIVFEESLKYKGTYPNIDGNRGTYEKHLLVHMRKGEKCYICGNIIVKEKIGGRGTYYCPYCQKK